MLRYCSQRSKVTLARGSSAIASSASRRTSASCSRERLAVEVAEDQRDGRPRSAPPSISVGCTKPSRPSVVSGDSVSAGRLATKRAAGLTGLTSFPFAVPGWTPTPWKVTFELDRRPGLVLDLADDRAVERVREVGAERLEVEVVDAAPDLLVDGERDPRRARGTSGCATS